MSKRKGNAEWKELKKEYWGQNAIVSTQEWGYIDFSPQGMKEVCGGEKLTYEEYLDAQMAIGRDKRGWFFLCHHEVPLGFAGQIERICRLMMTCSVRVLIRLSVRLVCFAGGYSGLGGEHAPIYQRRPLCTGRIRNNRVSDNRNLQD